MELKHSWDTYKLQDQVIQTPMSPTIAAPTADQLKE